MIAANDFYNKYIKKREKERCWYPRVLSTASSGTLPEQSLSQVRHSRLTAVPTVGCYPYFKVVTSLLRYRQCLQKLRHCARVQREKEQEAYQQRALH